MDIKYQLLVPQERSDCQLNIMSLSIIEIIRLLAKRNRNGSFISVSIGIFHILC